MKAGKVRTRNFTTVALAAGLLGGALAGCSSDDIAESVANDALEDTGASIELGGDLPAGFPAEVPVPDGELTFSSDTGGTFTLKIASDDPRADFETYTAQLESAGYAVSDTVVDTLAEPGGNLGVSAEGNGYLIAVGGYENPETYLGVVVTPQP
jgi:hypothetical protein